MELAQVELKEVFAILADAVAKEAEMEAAGASKEAIEKEWLPGQDDSRTKNGVAESFVQAIARSEPSWKTPALVS